ncbi:uncharacterized protein N7515_007774 [Penicillium bovifimosum]|uniref:Mob1/phocein n=1 Tax=Penicillium bovifimosum TaxID=126998 RepID=A0A9W9GLZ4_9EURO|nr:uncharacterized protein N7515_007774 [Penicillium bovifimosum]KAJ5123949.1 hypothetical protein N7515_007774 [Penicillium bovifimosum]
MTAAGVSPSSSPRLPSPPPFTEVQIGPQSPSVGEVFGKDGDLGEDDGSTRRIRPGTKAADMAFGPPLIPLSQLDSPFQLQEHLKALYNHFTKPEGSDVVVPINREVAIRLAEPPEGVDRSLWLYELCRFLTMKVNNLIIAFFAESPPCSAATCPEMRASEWQYLCAVHDPPKSCCAIDYCCHTLDWASNTLTSPKYFPSRLTLGSEAAGGPQASMRHLTNIFRRLYRIFAHAWFQHRDVFWEVEGHDGLYVFFKAVCDMYGLIQQDNYTIPPEAEGPDAVQQSAQQTGEEGPTDSKRLTILRKDDENPFGSAAGSLDPTLGTGATTRRHKHSPSTGSRVTTISEGAEDLEDSPQTPSPLREALEQSPERPVSVLEVPTSRSEPISEETSADIGEPSEDPVEEPREQPETEGKPSETPAHEEKTEQAGETRKTLETEQPNSEESNTKAESPVEASVEGAEEAAPSEQPEVKVEVTPETPKETAQEPSIVSEDKPEPEKEKEVS